MVEFFLILSAADPNISGGMFWRLLIGTVVMLSFGYMGEESWINLDGLRCGHVRLGLHLGR